LGYRLAGYDEILAIDFDQNSVETFRLNFPEVPCWQRDITTVTGQEILDFCEMKRGELDLLDGSPPCQGFSTAGKRNVNDSRNDLSREFTRLINDLQPKVFIMENVSGMVKGKMRGRFIEIMRELKGTGYNVKCKMLNAMHHNVPQSRQRLFFIGIRPDLNNTFIDWTVVFPKSNHKIITIKEALMGLPIDNTRTLNDQAFEIWKKCRNGEGFEKYHPKGHWFNSKKVNPNDVCGTIGKTSMKTSASGHFHWQYPRILNINELKRVASFPDDFQFLGSFEQQWARIGNAVMPNMMRAIAENLKKEVFDKMLNIETGKGGGQ
jgi:DNA (cytosine-5)-methyltransferase 1